MPAVNVSRRLTQLKTGDWLSKAIDSATVFSSPEHWTEPNLELHPSSAGGVCPRDIELHMLGHRTEMKIQNRRRMDNGTAAHARWTEELDRIGVLASAGVRMKVPGYWSGEYDLMCHKTKDDGIIYLGEIKTMNENKLRTIPAQMDDLEKMAYALYTKVPGYVYQVTQYLVMFQKQYPNLSDDVFFLLENTNNQAYVIRYFRPDEAMRKAAFERPELARDAALRGELLAPPFKRMREPCKSCYRQAICYSLQDGDVEAQKKVDEALYKTLHGLHSNVAEHEGRDALKIEIVTEPEDTKDYDIVEWD